MAEISLEIDYMVQMWREGAQFVAHAMPIDVMSSGPTQEDARTALDEAVRLFLKTAADLDTLVEVLEDSGYELVDGTWRAPHWVSVEAHSLSVVE